MKKFLFYLVSVIATLLLSLPVALFYIHNNIYSLEGLLKLSHYWNATNIIKLFAILALVVICTILIIKCIHMFICSIPQLQIHIRFFEYTHTYKIRFYRIAKFKWIFPLLAIMLSLIVLQSMMCTHRVSLEMRWFEKHNLIAHAAGGIDGITYTNTLEAFEENYKKGHRVFEFDLCFTADNVSVAEHDWVHYFRQIGKNYKTEAETPPVNYSEFIENKLGGNYTALDVKYIVDLMVRYPDIYVMTDFKHWYDKEKVTEAFSQIVRIANEANHPEILDRIIVQIYHYEFIDWVNSVHKFKNLLFTCYAASELERDINNLTEFCTRNNIDVIATRKIWVTEDYINKATDCGIMIYVHTENELDKAKEFITNGISGIYTDFLTPTEIPSSKK